MLQAVTTGRGPRVVLAHGFTQNGRCWDRFGELLDERFEVVRVDLPGHGHSVDDGADLWEAGRLLAEVGGRACYVGYSMGGRVLMHAALQNPDLVETMVLIGAHPGIEDPADRYARRASDEQLAARLERIGIEAFVDEWLSGPLFARLPPAVAHRAARVTNRVDGLAASLRQLGTGTQEPLWGRLATFPGRVALVAGEADPKFIDLNRRLAQAFGARASGHIVPGGHATHLEQPDALAAIVAEVIATSD